MTLEDISILFGDPVELSFEQALQREQGIEKDPASHVSDIHSFDLKPTGNHTEKAV